MKKNLFLLMMFVPIILVSIGCEKDETPEGRIIGKWRLVKGYDVLAGGFYNVPIIDQRIEEYTKKNQRIRYDYLGNEIVRGPYRITESAITVYGKDMNFTYQYWFVHDTLKIRHDGGFEYYDEYFVRMK